MSTPSLQTNPSPHNKARILGAILWPSFFAAGIGTMMLFAFLDPLDVAELIHPGAEVGREYGYTVGFLLFWTMNASACAFSWLLLRPGRSFNHAPLRGKHQQ